MISSLLNLGRQTISLTYLYSQFLTFYIPIFYSFKFLMSHNQPKIRTILKFWCVLSIFSIISSILSTIISQNIYPFLNLIILALLNYQQFMYSQKIFDMIIAPLYKQNKESIEGLSNQIQKIFNNKTQKLKNQAIESTGQKIRGFVGQLLVGTLNPKSSKSSSSGKSKKNKSENDGKNDRKKSDEINSEESQQDNQSQDQKDD